MLEILLIVGLCKWMGSIMRDKGRNPLILQIFTVIGWIGGEIGGAIVGVVMHALQNPDTEPGFGVYIAALVGAVVGAGIPFLIAFMLPAAQKTPQYSVEGNPFSRPIDPNNPYQSP